MATVGPEDGRFSLRKLWRTWASLTVMVRAEVAPL